jgi:hypothetical protein
MKRINLPAINIQFPFSQLIINGHKSIETRNYDIPSKYLNQKLLLIETPGPNRRCKAKIVGIIQFTESFRYKTLKQYHGDCKHHMVDKVSPYYWKGRESKFGWKVKVIRSFKRPFDAPKSKGISWTRNVSLLV